MPLGAGEGRVVSASNPMPLPAGGMAFIQGGAGPLPAPQDGDDLELMHRIRSGDRSAFATLVNRWWAPLVRYAVRLDVAPDAAEDFVQQALVALWRERKNWRGQGTPQAWLYRSVRNEALQERRRKEVRVRKAGDVAHTHAPVPSPLDVTSARELDEALQRALAELPARRREAFVLARYHALPLARVAEVMSVAPQTAANHVSLAMAELRRALADFLP